MTTLQEFDEKATSYLDKLTTYVEGRVILEMLKPLIHQAIEKSYLAGQNSMPQPGDVVRLCKELETDAYKKGREDEKKRVAGEIIKIKKQILKSLSRHPNWTYEDIEADIGEEVEKFTEEIPLFEGTLKQLEDLKQSIIK
jgi:hypothetical protein